MRAIQIKTTGGPEVMEVVEVPTPKPGAGQVLVKIEASGVNFIDTYLREGRYPAELPFIPGQEAAGTGGEAGRGGQWFCRGRSCGVEWNARERMQSSRARRLRTC